VIKLEVHGCNNFQCCNSTEIIILTVLGCDSARCSLPTIIFMPLWSLAADCPGPHYPVGTIGTMSRAYDILGPMTMAKNVKKSYGKYISILP